MVQETAKRGEAVGQVTSSFVKRIFVDGFKKTSEENTLYTYFSQFGRIELVDLVEDKATKKKRRSAYITYDDYYPVDKAVSKLTN